MATSITHMEVVLPGNLMGLGISRNVSISYLRLQIHVPHRFGIAWPTFGFRRKRFHPTIFMRIFKYGEENAWWQRQVWNVFLKMHRKLCALA